MHSILSIYEESFASQRTTNYNLALPWTITTESAVAMYVDERGKLLSIRVQVRLTRIHVLLVEANKIVYLNPLKGILQSLARKSQDGRALNPTWDVCESIIL